MKFSTPISVKAALFYNSLFSFRKKYDPLFSIKTSLAQNSQTFEEQFQIDLKWANDRFTRGPEILKKFPNLELSGKNILDFGCRFGGTSVYYATMGAKSVLGVDISEKYFEVGKHFASTKICDFPQIQNCDIQFKTGDSVNIPAPPDSIDLIISEDVVEHLEDPSAIFSEWYRILNPGGRICLSFGPLWFHPHGIHLWGIFQGPWMHVLFSEKTLVLTREIIQGKKISPSSDGKFNLNPELNRMTLKKFDCLISKFKFKREYFDIKCLFGLTPLSYLPVIREFFASEVHCVLRKF